MKSRAVFSPIDVLRVHQETRVVLSRSPFGARDALTPSWEVTLFEKAGHSPTPTPSSFRENLLSSSSPLTLCHSPRYGGKQVSRTPKPFKTAPAPRSAPLSASLPLSKRTSEGVYNFIGKITAPKKKESTMSHFSTGSALSEDSIHLTMDQRFESSKRVSTLNHQPSSLPLQ